jgi:DNA-binding transcriptional LysR family regulator
MNWDDLRFVLAVARHSTLTAAGASLGVRHSTVGRRLRAFESTLGVRLFDRTPNGLLLTSGGQEVVDVAERMETDWVEAQCRLRGRDAELTGPLRVSMLDYLFWGLSDAFTRFVEEHPGIELTLTSSLDPVSLIRREADVALRLTARPPDRLIGRRVGELTFAVYGQRALVERIGADAPLSAFPWIGWDARHDAAFFDTWLAEHAPGAQIRLRVDESALVRRQAVAAGIGLFFMPCFEADAMPELVQVVPPSFRRPLWMLTLADLRHTQRVRAFLEHMRGACVALTDGS